MTIPQNNLKALTPSDPPQAEHSGLAIWGLPALAVILAVLALVIVWFMGDWVGVLSVEARKTTTIWILCVYGVVVIAHLVALGTGAYSFAGRLFKRETGDTTKATTPLTRDIRLQSLCEDLRATHGWFWRYRMPWLMVSGSDELTAEVAPGLKQAGVMQVTDAILVHAAPDGIDAALWRKQVKQLRRRRPVDSLVQVERTGDEVRPDAEQPRMLAGIASDLGWAAPLTFLHAVPATGRQPRRFDAVGAFMEGSTAQSVNLAVAGLEDQLTTLEYQTVAGGVRLCREPDRIAWLAQVSAYIGEQRERIVTGWEALIASKWLRAPLAGVMFAPVFPGTGVVPAPVAEDATAAQEQSVTADGTIRTAADITRADTATALRVQPASLIPTWREIGASARHHSGRRVGFYWPNALAMLVMVAAIGWCVAMTFSFIGNRYLVHDAQASADAALAAAPGTPAALRAQLALQQQIEMFEYRQQHGAPWYLRAGLNGNDGILEALWQPYQTVANRNLQRPVVQTLQAELAQLSQVRADALQSHDAQRYGYNALKAYLMLAEPRRTDPAFLTGQIVAAWSAPTAISTGEWLDTSERLAGFYADHLKAHPEWRINASEPIVTAARNTLVNQIGLANADDTVYQNILDDAKGKYADASLTTLLAGTDAGGLFSTTQTVPGIYTRAAWDGMIADAIDKAASETHVSGDWVLSGGPAQSVSASVVQGAVTTMAVIDGKRASDDLKQRLTARYFAEYAAAWQGMLNSLQWQPAANLNGAIDQLTRLVDAQTSPLIALMKSVQYQAQAGRPSQGLTDTLVRKAQSLIGNDDKTQAPAVNPLDKPFGPLLALMGDSVASASNASNAANAPAALSGVSLAHYLTVVTTLRLKLQQISDSPDADAQAKQVAQSLFQGKGSELADTQTYAQLIAASLGAQWAGMGDALFVRPVMQATQTVLQPAQASLNDAWRQTIVATWNRSFAGRYPFANTDNDASLPELARFLRPEGGLIAAFLSTQLAGVLELQGDQWVPAATGSGAVTLDPAFLKALNTLQRIAGHLLAQGEPQYRFEFKPVPTPGVTDTLLTLDGQKLHYYNQQEAWRALTWPSNDPQSFGTRLQWQTEKAGTNKSFEFSGRWGLVRMLERARVQAVDDATYELTWQGAPDTSAVKFAQAATSASAPGTSSAARLAKAIGDDDETEAKDTDSLATHGPLTPASTDLTYPLSYMMRTDVGKGPLELLALRGFVLPARIFVGKGPAVAPATKKTAQTDGPPPLPKAMLDAARHAETPLPGGQRPL